MVVTLAYLWVSLPDLNRLRPELEAGLKQKFQLQELQLGKLAWQWHGDLEIHAAQVSLRSNDGKLSIQNSQLSLRISIENLLQGVLLPERVHVERGQVYIRSSSSAATKESPNLALPSLQIIRNLPLSPLHLSFADMQIDWQLEQHSIDSTLQPSWHKILHHVQGYIDTEQRSVNLRSDEITLQANFDADGQPQQIKLALHNMHWLPLPKSIELSQGMHGEIQLQRVHSSQWHLHASIASPSPAFVALPQAPFRLPLTSFIMDTTIDSTSLVQWSQWQRVIFNDLRWQHGEDNIAASGQWADGVLTLSANSSHLSMPTMWSWLAPIDDDPDWRSWLTRMHHGIASDARAEITLPWPEPWHAPPPSLEPDAFIYHVTAQVRDADIDLGQDGESLLHTRAHVELDQHALEANIAEAELPHKIGRASGKLRIPWETLILDIQAKAKNVSVARLHRWVDPEGAALLGWKRGRAKGNVRLHWDPTKSEPDMATAELSPVQPWKLHIQGQNVFVSEGSVRWKLHQGLQANDLSVQGDILAGKVDFKGAIKNKEWSFSTFSGDISVPLARLVHTYHIPIAAPEGIFNMRLIFDRSWNGAIDFTHASWSNFLGEKKERGQPLQMQFSAHLLAKGGVMVERLLSRTPLYYLRGYGRMDHDGLSITLEDVKTRAFDGSIQIDVPKEEKPWSIQVEADYLRRLALPETLSISTNKKQVGKNWNLQASIKRFDWKDARMKHVYLQMKSKINSPATFSASSIDMGNLHLKSIHARFSLPGQGHVTLENFQATMNEQSLQLKAFLAPLADGSMHWQGFASSTGDFSQMMKRGGFSSMFKGGKAQMLFAGEGLFMRNQSWWSGLRGRLRLRVDEGSIAKGGFLTKVLAITSIADLPALLIGRRKDLTHAGLFFERLQIEASVQDQQVEIHQLAMRSTAMDMAGKGQYNLDGDIVDLMMVFHPLQNLDAILGKIPILRDLIGGSAHSLIRKVYHLHGLISKVEIDQVTPSSAGLARPGLIETLLTLPDRWFGGMKEKQLKNN